MDRNFKTERVIAGVLVVVLCLSLVPILLISPYNHPSVDDFAYGAQTALTWQTTHSLGEVLKTAAAETVRVYGDWQGTFSAIFLMTLQPSIFGEGAYVFVTPLLLGLLLSSVFFFLHVLLKKYWEATTSQWLIIGSLLVTAMIQFIYLPVEGLFWYNGSIYYVGYFSLSLFLYGLLLHLPGVRGRGAKGVLTLLGAALAFFIGGGNYTTILMSLVIFAFGLLYLFLRDRGNFWYLLVVTAAMGLAFFISVVAPGNAIRQLGAGPGTNPVVAILLSFVFGVYTAFNATTGAAIFIWCFLAPFLFFLAKRSSFRFEHPLLATGLLYCIYCTQGTPPFYALGLTLPERLINIIYMSYWIFGLVLLFYWAGWVARQLDRGEFGRGLVERVSGWLGRYGLAAALVAFLFIGGASVGKTFIVKDEETVLRFTNAPTSLSCAWSLLNGEAELYHQQMLERVALYEDPTLTRVEVPPLIKKPAVLFNNDITEDMGDWRNEMIVKFYRKESIVIKVKE